jgi:hypothetical protein
LVLVIATQGCRAWDAVLVGTAIAERTRITIVAGECVGDIRNAYARVARVVGAGVAIIEGDDGAKAGARGAAIFGGAGVRVVTRVGVEGIDAAVLRVTAFVGAGVVVVT